MKRILITLAVTFLCLVAVAAYYLLDFGRAIQRAM